MYIPTAFEEKDQGKLHDFIVAHSFGLLFSTQRGEPFASHLPFLLEREAGPHGTLVGHMARANPQWQGLDGRPVLAVFAGPHAYVSPSWYEAEEVVPTWNYVAVHAYGTCRLIEDSDAVKQILAASVPTYERSMPKPWGLDTDTDFFRSRVRAVVGFRIEIGRLEGKWKLNQNHPPERRERVARLLAGSEDEGAREIARLMIGMLGQPAGSGPVAEKSV
jgi:transcriptional regulator